MMADFSEGSPYAKKESSPPILANRSREFDGTEYGVHQESNRAVHGKIRRLWPVGQSVRLANLEHAKKVHAGSQQRWQFHQLVDQAGLPEKILVGKQFIGTPSHEPPRSTQGECGYTRLSAVTASSESAQKQRGRFTDTEKTQRLDLRKWESGRRCGLGVKVLGVRLKSGAGARKGGTILRLYL